MKFDKTCCGTTCNAKANAEYVKELEAFISEFDDRFHQQCSSEDFEHDMVDLRNTFIHLFKRAQQNNSTNGAS